MSTQNDLINYKDVIKEANSLINEQIKLWGGVVSSINQVGKVTPSSFVNTQKQVNEALIKSTELTEKQRLADIKLQQAREKAFDDYEKKLKKQVDEERKAAEAAVTAAEKKRIADIKLQQAREKAFDDYDRKLKKEAEAERRAAEMKDRNAQREQAAQQRKEAAAQRAIQKTLEQNRAHNRLQASWRNAQKALQDSIVTDGLKARSTKRLQREFNDLDKRIKQVDAATKNYSKNVGNYRSAMGGLGGFAGQLSGALGIAGGIYGAVQLGREIYKTTKQLDLINKSMNATAMNAEHLASNMAFLNRVTEDSGLRFTDTALAYNKFYAASKDKLSLIEIQTIFDKISKSAALMGMSVHDQNLIFLALEQMMSKGKVSAEELRRQLGERLPGAFDIMAKAAGVSASELDDMMRKGELISSEILPKFAVEVEKAFSADKIQKVENMAAAENRLSNAWIHLVDSMNSGQGTLAKVSMGFMDMATSVLKAFTVTQKLSDAIGKEQVELNMLIGRIVDLNENNKERASLINQLKNNYPDFISFIKDEDYSNKNLLKTLELVNDNYRDRILLQTQVENTSEAIRKRDALVQKQSESLLHSYRQLIEINNKYDLGLTITPSNIQETISEMGKLRASVSGLERDLLKVRQPFSRSMSQFEKDIKLANDEVEAQKAFQEELYNSLGIVTEAEKAGIKRMKDYNATLEERVKIAKELGGVDGKDFSSMNLESVNAYIRSLEKINETESKVKNTRDDSEKLRLKALETDYKIAEQRIKNEIAVTDNFEEQMLKKYELANLWYNYELEKAKGNAKQIMLITEQMTSKMIALNEEEKNHAIKSADEKSKAEEEAVKKRLEAANKLRDAIRAARASQGNISQTSIQIEIESLGGNRGSKYWDLQTKLLEDYYQTERDLAEGNALKLAEIDKEYTLESIKLQNDRKEARSEERRVGK